MAVRAASLKKCGTDTSDNIVVVYPNHRRILERSDVKFISKTRSKVIKRLVRFEVDQMHVDHVDWLRLCFYAQPLFYMHDVFGSMRSP